MTPFRHKETTWAFVFLDWALFYISFNVASFFRASIPSFPFKGTVELSNFGIESIPLATAIAGLIFVVVQYLYGTYDMNYSSPRFLWLQKLLTTNTISLLIFLSYLYTVQNFGFPRSLLVTTVFFNCLLTSSWRILLSFRTPKKPTRIGIIAQKEHLEHILSVFSRDSFARHIVISAIFTDDIEHATQKHHYHAYHMSDIQNMLKKTLVDAIIIAPGGMTISHETFAMIKSIPGCVRVFLVPTLYEVLLGDLQGAQIGDLPIIEIPSFQKSISYTISKRCLDILISVTGIALLALPMLVIALLIKLSSPGPALFYQARIGQKKQPFRIYKFRTMHVDSDSIFGTKQAAANDPRVTLVGRFLRKTRLDETPQLFNILKGDMSLVGPRPLVPDEVERFEKTVPAFAERHSVKPGITGLAQICGNYETQPDIKLRYDLAYMRRQSLIMDLRIMVKTAKTVLTRAGQ